MTKFLFLTMLTYVTFLIPAQAETARCEIELQNGRGFTLQTFNGYGYTRNQACIEAQRDCQRTIRARYYRARVQRCVMPNRNQFPIVTRSCTARLSGPLGVIGLTNFYATARGIHPVRVQRRACEDALNQCHRAERRISRRFTQCRIVYY